MERSARLIAAVLLLLGALLAACGTDDGDSGGAATTASTVAPTTPGTTATTTADQATGTLTVFAAASLMASFNEIGAAFAKANPQAKTTFSFDASSALVGQIVQGAPADVFASADTANMDKLTTPGLNAEAPVIFATNELAIIVAKANPKGIEGVEDLDRSDLKVVLCADGVPCGTYAKQILAAAGVAVTPVSYEQNVKGVVTKVTAGEADAGIVYTTDVEAAGDAAEGVEIPDKINVIAKYPAAAVKASTNLSSAEAFVDYLLGADAQVILAKYGFGKP